jgi:hypothetical protein
VFSFHGPRQISGSGAGLAGYGISCDLPKRRLLPPKVEALIASGRRSGRIAFIMGNRGSSKGLLSVLHVFGPLLPVGCYPVTMLLCFL